MMKLLAAAALATAGLATVAGADGIAVGVRHVDVGYGDLDLARSADAETMLSRIERAAKRACDRRSVHGVYEFRDYRACAGAADHAPAPPR